MSQLLMIHSCTNFHITQACQQFFLTLKTCFNVIESDKTSSWPSFNKYFFIGYSQLIHFPVPSLALEEVWNRILDKSWTLNISDDYVKS